jgi:hypothetical protein
MCQLEHEISEINVQQMGFWRALRTYSALRAPVILEKICEKFQFGGKSAKVYLKVAL